MLKFALQLPQLIMKDPHGTILWTSVDPLAEKHPEMSPYLYCYDNPINYVDLFGLEGKTVEEAMNNWSDFKSDFNTIEDWVELKEVECIGHRVEKNIITGYGKDVGNTYWNQINFVIDFLKKTSDYMGYIGSLSGSLDEYKEYGSNFKTSKKLKIYSSSFYGNQYTKVYAIGKKLKRIGQVGNTLSVLCSAAKTITSQSQNRGQIAMNEAGSLVGSWTGGIVGMKLGASCGIYFGPYGAIAGGVTCGIIGGIIGEEAFRSYFNDIYIEYGD